MARVHLFTSHTPYNKRRSPSQENEFLTNEETTKITLPDELDVDAVPSSPSCNNNASPSRKENDNNNDSANNNAALAAALLQNTHNSMDVVEAVAAALAVKPDTLLKEVQKNSTEAAASSSSSNNKEEKQPEVVGEAIDKAAAVTALQLLGLSQADIKKDKEPIRSNTTDSNNNSSSGTSSSNSNNNNAGNNGELDSSNVMLIANYPGLSNHIDDIDLSTEDMIQDYKRGTWTREEDELLLAGIKKYGYGRWKEIANSIPGRKGKQLKQRWDNTLAAKYVDQDWLKSKIRNDQSLIKNPFGTLPTSSSTADDKDKAFKLSESDWDGIMQKISEKAKEGDQNGIEVLLSQALLGIVAGSQKTSTSVDNTTTTTTTSTTTATTPATIAPNDNTAPLPSTQVSSSSIPTSSLIPDPPQSTPTSPTVTKTTSTQQQDNSAPLTSTLNNASTTAVNNNENLSFNFNRMVNNPPPLNFADAAALALYAQQLSQQQQQSNTTCETSQSNVANSTLAALANHPFFQCGPFNHSVTDNATAAAAAAAVAAITSVAQQQQQQQQQQQNNNSTTNNNQIEYSPSRTSTNLQKRRRSDPALADTQSAAMTIYASSSPITTTVNNQTQTVYPCLFPNCGKTFARLYNLKSHSRTHTDDRPFICHACQAAFSRNHDLKRHTKIHGGEKPYKCTGCNKSFSRLDALKRHKSNQRNKTACMSN